MEQNTPALNADLQDLIRMATAIITIKLMMDSPDTNLSEVEEKSRELIKQTGGEFYKTEVEEVAFGLKAMKLTFTCDEKLGSDAFEEKLKDIDGVSNAQCVDFRRALG